MRSLGRLVPTYLETDVFNGLILMSLIIGSDDDDDDDSHFAETDILFLSASNLYLEIAFRKMLIKTGSPRDRGRTLIRSDVETGPQGSRRNFNECT